MAATDATLPARVEQLRAAKAYHKAAIGRHRRQLHDVATELSTLERECRRLGIAFILEPPGVGDVHGHRKSDDEPDRGPHPQP